MEKFSKSRVSGKVPDKNTLILWSYPNFLTTLFRIGQRKLTRQKPALSSSRFNTLPACDGRTEGQTHDDSIYPAVKMNITALTTVIIIIIITTHTHIHTQPFNGPLSGTTQVCWYQKKHSPTHTHTPIHLLSTSSVYYDRHKND